MLINIHIYTYTYKMKYLPSNTAPNPQYTILNYTKVLNMHKCSFCFLDRSVCYLDSCLPESG